MYKIEKGIPISASRKTKYSEITETVRAMTPGESFVINLVANPDFKPTSIRTIICRAGQRFHKKIKFASIGKDMIRIHCE